MVTNQCSFFNSNTNHSDTSLMDSQISAVFCKLYTMYSMIMNIAEVFKEIGNKINNGYKWEKMAMHAFYEI